MNIIDEPTNEPCMNCDYDPMSDEYKNLCTQDDRGICISCATSDDKIFSNNRDIINQHLQYDIEEGEFDEVEDGWFTKGTFGMYSVEFKTREAEVRKRIAVDDEKILGYYIKLDDNGKVTILEPHNVKIDYDLSNSTTKEKINEKRSEDAIDPRR